MLVEDKLNLDLSLKLYKLVLQISVLNVMSNEGMTTLYYAVNSGHENICAYLIGCGADIEQKSDEGYFSQ